MDLDQRREYKQWLRELQPDGMSQEAVAEALGVSRKTISRLLTVQPDGRVAIS